MVIPGWFQLMGIVIVSQNAGAKSPDFQDALDYYNDLDYVTDVENKTRLDDARGPDMDPEDEVFDYEDYAVSTFDVQYELDDRPREDQSVQNFLTQSSLEMLRSVSTQVLTDYSKNEAILEVLPNITLAKLELLLDRIPAEVSASIAAREGLLMRMSDERVVLFANNLKVLYATDSKILLQLANERPRIVPQLPNPALRHIVDRPGFVKSLKTDTIKTLVDSDAMAQKLKELPNDIIAMIVTYHPRVLTYFPPGHYPLKPIVTQLMMNETFLAMVPIQAHAYLAQTNFRHELTAQAVLKILGIYPSLPTRLSLKGLALNRVYLHNQEFLTHVKCSVFLTCANDIAFVNRLGPEDIRALAQNRHMWECLPVSVIRKIMKESRLGDTLDLKEVLTAATTMSALKSLDWKVVSNLARFQVPDMFKQLLFKAS
eukprot:maker-scaffold18_size714446-snap-gene-2.9 protein:Tk08457 transcript:maker-scaffold18_size714446-snap-gene-2.9-mRNA-1 annotation:"putative uncharacterized protein"